MTHHPIAIIGGGPAGIACAVLLYHAGLNPLLIERDQLGGLLRSANWVENYPGFPDGIKGSELAELFRSQLLKYKPELEFATVTAVNWDESLFNLAVGDRTISAEILVVATGTMPKQQPAFCHKPELIGKIYNEIIPLLEEKDKTIGIVGGGDAAFDYALNLAQANAVVIFSRSPQPKCLPGLEELVHNNPQIRYFPGREIHDINMDHDSRLLLAGKNPTEVPTMTFDFILFAIGREPNVDFLSPALTKAKGDLEKNERLFFIGDVINGHYRQTAIAVGQGVMAAMRIMGKVTKA